MQSSHDWNDIACSSSHPLYPFHHCLLRFNLRHRPFFFAIILLPALLRLFDAADRILISRPFMILRKPPTPFRAARYRRPTRNACRFPAWTRMESKPLRPIRGFRSSKQVFYILVNISSCFYGYWQYVAPAVAGIVILFLGRIVRNYSTGPCSLGWLV